MRGCQAGLAAAIHQKTAVLNGIIAKVHRAMTFRDFMLVVVLLGLAGVAVVALAPSLAEVRRLREEIAQLQEKQKAQEDRFVLLRQEMDDLQRGEARAVERVAREKFGYCRPGEEIIHMD